MARIRTIKPEFFRSEKLQDMHIAYPQLNIMLVFAGLWTLCDNQGVFEWKPRSIKLDILPFIDFDMEKALEVLKSQNLITQFEVNGKSYGYVNNFSEHQRISGKELTDGKRFPSIREATEKQQGSNREATGKQQGSNGEATEKQQGVQERKGKEKEKEKERTTDYAHTREDQFPVVGKMVEDDSFFEEKPQLLKIPDGIQDTPGGAPPPRPWDEKTVAECLAELRQDWQFMESLQRMYRIDASIIPEWMEAYEIWKLARDGPVARVKDVRSHFINWLRGRDLTKPAKVFKDEQQSVNRKANGGKAQHTGFDLLDAELDRIIQDQLRDNPIR
jgi:hypothetical protein